MEAVATLDPTRLILAAVIGLVILLVLIIKCKVQAMISILVGAISIGSSTVAMTMAAGISAAMPGISSLSPLYLACVTAAIAGGSTVYTH